VQYKMEIAWMAALDFTILPIKSPGTFAGAE
jgi:hypothetical protein